MLSKKELKKEELRLAKRKPAVFSAKLFLVYVCKCGRKTKIKLAEKELKC